VTTIMNASQVMCVGEMHLPSWVRPHVCHNGNLSTESLSEME
jgi:hypothetical protein